MTDLTDLERQILDFEASGWWRYLDAKESAVFSEFGMSATRYYMVLNSLIDRPEAMAYDPMVVKRLQRLREARRRRRASVAATFAE